jgi:hypothetical protein
MMMRAGVLVVLPVALLLAGCGPESTPTQPQPSAEGSRYLLATEPAGAKGVTELREQAQDGDEVVVVGRIGGGKDPWLKNRAGFWIVDTSLKSCTENGCDCETPWDFCCDGEDVLGKARILVKFEEAPGKTVEADARQLLGLKELNTVVVQGRAKREEGNLTVLATGLHVRP